MSESERDARIRRWLAAREAGEVPVSMRDAVAGVPYHQPQSWPRGITPAVGIAIAAAALVVVTLIGYQFLGGPSVGGPGPLPPVATPTSLPTATPSPTPAVRSFDGYGQMIPGIRYTYGQAELAEWRLIHGDPPPSPSVREFSFVVPTAGWVADQWQRIEKTAGPHAVELFIADYEWTFAGNATCALRSLDPPAADASSAEVAAAISLGTGIKDVAVSETTVGGLPAKVVRITLPEAFGCNYQDGTTQVIWIVDLGDRPRLFSAGYDPGTAPAILEEVQQIIDSVRFE